MVGKSVGRVLKAAFRHADEICAEASTSVRSQQARRLTHGPLSRTLARARALSARRWAERDDPSLGEAVESRAPFTHPVAAPAATRWDRCGAGASRG